MDKCVRGELHGDASETHVEHREKSRLVFAPVALKTGLAAHYLGISRRHLATLAARGMLPYVLVGPRCHLFMRNELDTFLKTRTVTARGRAA